MKESILACLSPGYPWADRVHWFPTIDSTNSRLKAMASQGAPHGTVLIAGHQTDGRGRMGRSFHSPQGVGIYLSVLLRPQCMPGDLMHLTCAAAVAACDAVENIQGIRPGIKWTNDLVWGKRKLAGILTELVLDHKGQLAGAIIGIGINCSQRPEDFPPEIREIATSLAEVSGTAVDQPRLIGALLDAFSRMDRDLLTRRSDILDRYRRDCVTLGQEISLHRGDIVRHGKALDIDPEGALIVAFDDGCVECVSSGEVSIRGMYGYL